MHQRADRDIHHGLVQHHEELRCGQGDEGQRADLGCDIVAARCPSLTGARPPGIRRQSPSQAERGGEALECVAAAGYFGSSLAEFPAIVFGDPIAALLRAALLRSLSSEVHAFWAVESGIGGSAFAVRHVGDQLSDSWR